MSRASAGVLTSAGSITLPIISVYATATVAPALREVGVFNNTSTSCSLKLIRLTSTGTQGAGITRTFHDDTAGSPACTAFTTHTVAPTLGGDLGYRVVLGAAVGSGVIWTFGDTGIRVPIGT